MKLFLAYLKRINKDKTVQNPSPFRLAFEPREEEGRTEERRFTGEKGKREKV